MAKSRAALEVVSIVLELDEQEADSLVSLLISRKAGEWVKESSHNSRTQAEHATRLDAVKQSLITTVERARKAKNGEPEIRESYPVAAAAEEAPGE